MPSCSLYLLIRSEIGMPGARLQRGISRLLESGYRLLEESGVESAAIGLVVGVSG